jgi:hypothetical protein
VTAAGRCLKLYETAPPQGRVLPPPIVEAFDVLDIALASSMRVFQRRRLSSSVCMCPQKDSTTALSYRSPTLPMRAADRRGGRAE